MSGLIFNVKSLLKENAIKQELQERVEKNQAALDSLVLADSNYFCPIKTGTLQKSAIINTRLGSGEIIWRTPYARRLYNEYERPEHQANPNATSKWFEAAKARWLEKWVRLINERVKRS